MPDARCTRGLVCEVVQKKLHTSIQGSGEHPTFPAQWLYGLYRAHPGDQDLLVTVAPRIEGIACARLGRLRLRGT